MAWAESVGAHWKKIEAEYNAEWAKLAYLDGPGYTAWDKIEAKFDLRRKYFSGSSSHGVQNSSGKTPTQLCSSQFKSPTVEWNGQCNSRMAENSREIRESCAKILELLQEEIDATETSDALPTSDKILALVEPIEEHSVTDESVHVKNLIVTSIPPSIDFNGGTMDLLDADPKKSIDTSKSFRCDKFSFESNVRSLVHASLLKQDVIYPEVTTEKTISLSRNIATPDWGFQKTIGKIAAAPEPPPERPDFRCYILSATTTLSTSPKIATCSLLELHMAASFPIRRGTLNPTSSETIWTSLMTTHISHARLQPPPKPPDRNFQNIPVEFLVTRNFTISPPPPEPPDADHIAVKAIALPCVALAACPPTVWENVCVNGIKISIGLSTISVYLNFKEVLVEDISQDTCVLGCHMFLLHSDWNIFQPAPPFMLSQSIPPVQHLRENECEQVILVVYLGAGSYGPIALEYGYTIKSLRSVRFIVKL